MKKWIAFLFLVVSGPIVADAKDQCLVDGKFRYHKFGKEITEKASYCFDEARLHLSSKNCQGEGANCVAIQRTKRQIKMTELVGQFGSPGFKLCFRYGGMPQLLEFFDGKAWIKLNRCTFQEDHSFLDTDSLFLRMQK